MTKKEFIKQTGHNLIEIDDKLYYNNTLNLYESQIKELPDNLTVKGNLILKKSKIESLPKNLTVIGYLDLYDTEIKEFPKDLFVGKFIRCYVDKITNKGLYLFGIFCPHIYEYSIIQDRMMAQFLNFKEEFYTLDDFIEKINEDYINVDRVIDFTDKCKEARNNYLNSLPDDFIDNAK